MERANVLKRFKKLLVKANLSDIRFHNRCGEGAASEML
jgi:hypothetical protein